MDAEGQTFEFVAQIASNSLYDLSSQLRKVEKLALRGNSTILASSVGQLSSQTAKTTSDIHRILDWPKNTLSTLEEKNKQSLNNEYDHLLERVKEVQAKVTKRLKQQQQQQQQLKHEERNETTPLLQAGSQIQIQQQVLDQLDQGEVDLHTALVEERDNEIAEIQRSAREINAIFQDLGVLVSEQGQQVDTVENNLTDLASRTERAGQQLTRAENYQRSKGKYTCMFLCFILFITIIVAISILA